VLTLTPPQRAPGAAAARDAILASVRPELATPDMLDRCIGPAAARHHAAHLALPRTPTIRRLGAGAGRPEVSVLVPLYRNLSFLRAQLAAFATDPAWGSVETIFVLDSPEQEAEVEHLLRGLVAMHGLPLTLVVPPRNLGYAAANNLGSGLATAPLLLLLNSDVIPDRPGWLAPLAEAAARHGLAGPKLLFDDASIQHAGMLFSRDADGVWYNRHYGKGMPRGLPQFCLPREVPAVTGAALMVRRTLFETAGGFDEGFIVGDYEDSDLCLRLRRLGASARYVPQSELWHFERRSMVLHGGHSGTLASQINRRRQVQLWDAEIESVMARFDAWGAL